MVYLAATGLDQLCIGDGGDLHPARLNVHNASIAAGALGVIVAVAWMKRARHVSAVGAVDVAGRAAGGGGEGGGGGV